MMLANLLSESGRVIRRLALLPCLAFTISAATAVTAPADTAMRRILLTNGVRLLVKPEAEGDTLVITLFVREPAAVSASEEAVRSLVNGSLFYGSVHLSFEAAEALASKVGVITTKQTPDCLSITCVTSPNRFRDAIYALCEVIKNAQFAPEALDRARTDLLTLRAGRASNPFLSAYDALSRKVFSRFEPDQVQLRHVSHDQAVTYFKSHFVPAATVFCAVGKIDASAVQRSLDNNLFDYDRPGKDIPAPVHSGRTSTILPDTVTSQVAGNVSYALVGVDTPSITDPDYPAFYVLTTLLGGGHSSRMFQQVREASGIGYSVGTSLQPEEGDPMIAYIEWEPAHNGKDSKSSAEILKMIQHQLDDIASPQAAVTDAELQRARNFAAGQYVLKHERIQARAFLPGWYEAMGAGFEFDSDLPARFTSVSKDDLLRVARKHLPSRASYVADGAK